MCFTTVLFGETRRNVLRRDHENKNTLGNPWNFIATLGMLVNHDYALQKHFDGPTLRNATYLSPQIQIKLIDVTEYSII